MTMTPQTPFTETEALLAVMNDDTARLGALLDDMLPNELRELSEHAHRLMVEVENRRADLR